LVRIDTQHVATAVATSNAFNSNEPRFPACDGERIRVLRRRQTRQQCGQPLSGYLAADTALVTGLMEIGYWDGTEQKIDGKRQTP
jgi:hypothetical protein